MGPEKGGTSAVTIVLPTYNRASFLSEAFTSIERQTFTDWELVVVDDGSTDDTRAMVDRFADSHAQTVRYFFQRNRGPSTARNLGVSHAGSPLVAFFDSDDIWQPDYLANGVGALDSNPDVDWVYSACTIVEVGSGRVLDPNTFYVNGQPRPLLALTVEKRDHGFNVIVDPRALECQIAHGLYCGPQNSIIRRSLFDRCSFPEHLRLGEDQFLVMSALAQGKRLAYSSEPRVIYRIHDDNLSGASTARAKFVAVLEPFVRALQRLPSELSLNRRELRQLHKRIGREYFWHLGYAGLWQTGQQSEAIAMYWRGLTAWPWDLAAWKTYVLAHLKRALGAGRPRNIVPL
jgi:glycosyltransferase involved in cell wall biosynthesis